MKKFVTKPQTRQITAGVTLVGYGSVEKWDEDVRKAVAEKREASYTKEVTFTPDFALT